LRLKVIRMILFNVFNLFFDRKGMFINKNNLVRRNNEKNNYYNFGIAVC